MSCVSFSNKQNDKLQEVGNVDLEIYNENNSDRRNPNEQVLAKENEKRTLMKDIGRRKAKLIGYVLSHNSKARIFFV